MLRAIYPSRSSSTLGRKKTMSRITREAHERGEANKGRVPVDPEKIRSMAFMPGPWIPDFYDDIPFTCKDCGKDEVWTATQQKWWYEVAGGLFETTAVRCRVCRQKERIRKEEARKTHLEGIQKEKNRA